MCCIGACVVIILYEVNLFIHLRSLHLWLLSSSIITVIIHHVVVFHVNYKENMPGFMSHQWLVNGYVLNCDGHLCLQSCPVLVCTHVLCSSNLFIHLRSLHLWYYQALGWISCLMITYKCSNLFLGLPVAVPMLISFPLPVCTA